jgi:BMFP domain-containing protein YqiC
MKKFVSKAVRFYRSETDIYRAVQQDHSHRVAPMATQEQLSALCSQQKKQYDKLVDICSRQRETIDILLKRIKKLEAATSGHAIKPSSLTTFASSGNDSDSVEEYHTDEEELEKETNSLMRKGRRCATKRHQNGMISQTLMPMLRGVIHPRKNI